MIFSEGLAFYIGLGGAVFGLHYVVQSMVDGLSASLVFLFNGARQKLL